LERCGEAKVVLENYVSAEAITWRRIMELTGQSYKRKDTAIVTGLGIPASH
jgi:hypothetical protein